MTATAAMRHDDDVRDARHHAAKAYPDLKAWLDWLKVGGASPHTYENYEWRVAPLLRAHPEKTMRQFTYHDLLAILGDVPIRSRGAHKAAYASWFDWGYTVAKIIRSDPSAMLPKIRRQAQQVLDVFSEAECEALMSLPSPDGYLATILLESGIRRAEAINLTARRLRPSLGAEGEHGKLIVVEGAKGQRSRIVPMSQRLAVACVELVTLEGIQPHEYVWGSHPGGAKRTYRHAPISAGAFYDWWRRVIAEAGVKYRKPHASRHTFATTWRRRGLALDDIQALLGHADISTTERVYVHSTHEDVAKRMAALWA